MQHDSIQFTQLRMILLQIMEILIGYYKTISLMKLNNLLIMMCGINDFMMIKQLCVSVVLLINNNMQ